MATSLQRAHLDGLMRWTIALAPRIHYRQARPMATRHLREQELWELLTDPQGSVAFDCSEGVTFLCRLAGLADPNGLGYDGQGFTGTLLGHLPHYADPKAAGVGALVVFGPGTGEHVAMVLEPGADPLLWSHGREAGPVTVRLSAERAAHRPPVTFLSVASL